MAIDSDFAPDDWIALLALARTPEVRITSLTLAPGFLPCDEAEAVWGHISDLADARSLPPLVCGDSLPSSPGRAFPAAWREEAVRVARSFGPVRSRSRRADPAERLAELLSGPEPPDVLLALGPLTNLAGLDRHRPVPTPSTRLVVMGGALDVPGNVGPADDAGADGSAEWNLRADPRAADRVLRWAGALDLVPLDATGLAPVTPERVREVLDALDGPVHDFVARVWGAQAAATASGEIDLWDPLAAAVAVRPALVDWRATAVRVDTAVGSSVGRLVPTEGAPRVRIAVGVRSDAVFEWLTRALVGDPL